MVEPDSGGSEHLLTLRLNSTTGPVTQISVYAPTLSATPDTKDMFYENLAAVIRNIPRKEQVVLGDFNAKMGADHDSWPSYLGQFRVGKMNENGSDYWRCAPSMTCALQTPSSAQSLNTRFLGDTQAQSTGTNWI